jgi:hypothetical protein
MITLTMSKAPKAKSITSESRKLRERPKMMVVIPKTVTQVNITSPDRFRSGRIASSNPMIAAPTAGALRMRPSPRGPTCRISSA